MPTYVASPFKPPVQLLVAGTPSYVFGGYNDRTGPTKGYVISDSAVTTTGTLTFQITEGNVPAVGSLISVVGTSNASGNFNVTNVAIASVSNTDEGICTVTYAITSSSVGANTPDSGQVIIPQPETSESIGNVATLTSVPVALPYANQTLQQGRTISADVSFPSVSGVTATAFELQGANIDLDSEYVNLTPSGGGASGHLATIAAGTVSGGHAVYGDDIDNYRFFRIKGTGISGSDNTKTIIAKIEA